MKCTLKLILYFLLLQGFIACHNQEKSSIPGDFTDSLFTAGIEGPAVDAQGNLYAVNYKKEGTIGIITPDAKGDLFVSLPTGSIGNGIRFNSNKNMFVADYTGHNILTIDMKSKNIKIFAHDSSMNQPNDISITKNDIIYASDPNWKESTGKLWKITADGKTFLLEDRMGTTNGIEVGFSDKVLYVNESIQKNVWAYDILPDGNLSNKRLLISFKDEHGLDGMRCDVDGNLYITRYGKGSVVKVSPEGKVVKEFFLKGKKPTNIAFGGIDGKTCFVTLQDRGVIEKFNVESPGREWALIQKK
jgi:gluconolactonase